MIVAIIGLTVGQMRPQTRRMHLLVCQLAFGRQLGINSQPESLPVCQAACKGQSCHAADRHSLQHPMLPADSLYTALAFETHLYWCHIHTLWPLRPGRST